MTEPWIRYEDEFRAVMSYVTDRAWTEGLEEEVKVALFDVLDRAARRSDRVRRLSWVGTVARPGRRRSRPG
jgi:hypothetical protein